MAKPKKFRPAIGKRLKTVLAIVFALFALIVVNSVYLVSVTVQGEERQGWFYLWMFLLHLILGLLICLLYTSPSPRDKTVSRMPSSA